MYSYSTYDTYKVGINYEWVAKRPTHSAKFTWYLVSIEYLFFHAVSHHSSHLQYDICTYVAPTN